MLSRQSLRWWRIPAVLAVAASSGCSSTAPEALREAATASTTIGITAGQPSRTSTPTSTAVPARRIPTQISPETSHWIAPGLMTDESIELMWSAVDGDDVVHQLFRFDGIGFDPTTLQLTDPLHEGIGTLGWTDESVEPGSFYTYVMRVIADDRVLERRWATALAITDTTPPRPITGLTASVVADGVLLEWLPSTDDVEFGSYAVYRIGTDGSARYLGGGGDQELTSFIDDEIPTSGELRYQVLASDFHGNRSTPVDIVISLD